VLERSFNTMASSLEQSRDGTIQVHSPAGQGARLRIDLPIQDRPSS
jgi:signal transduction histidine kinase